MQAAAGVVIRPWDPAGAPGADFEARYEIYLERHAEETPEDSIAPYDEFRKDFDQQVSWVTRHRFEAVDAADGRLLGTAGVGLSYTETNRHVCGGTVTVRADSRRRGIGSRLLAEVLRVAQGDGRTLFDGGTIDGGPGDAFLSALGARRVLVDRKSRLRMADVDRGLMGEWVAKAAERAAGYELVFWEDRCPDEHLEAFVELGHVMNTAPRDDMDVEDFVQTPERFREAEAKGLEQGYGGWTLVALHRETGEMAGFTELGFARWEPTVAWQGGTGVLPAHRDRGIGRWLKAAMVLRLLEDRPAVERIDTWNARSNDAMLAINIAMGFREVRASSSWQMDVGSTLTLLEARIGAAPEVSA